jgi:predicted transcriptional regulator
MEAHRLTGRSAGVLKYDLLTALSVTALAGSQTMQTSVLRLVALVTARYNWQSDEFCVGQRDLARMWSVNERTVKREIKRLIDSGLIVCKRQGVRGRVGAYALNHSRIAELSRNSWSLVGPDFDLRMRERHKADASKVVAICDFRKDIDVAPAQAERGTWASAMANLRAEAPNLYHAWLSKLELVRFEHGVLELRATSSFVQRYVETHHMKLLLHHAEQELGVVKKVQIQT